MHFRDTPMKSKLIPLVLAFTLASIHMHGDGTADLNADEPAKAVTKDKKDEKGFKAIFDGKSFAGWEGNEDLFRIEEKSVVGGNLKKPIPNNEFLCTKKSYANIELRLQAKLIGEGANAGIQFRTKRIPNHHEVSGYQCDMGNMEGRSIWGSLYDESRRRKFLAHGEKETTEKAFRAGEWNDFVIRCEGTRIQIWLNGVQTVDYREEEKDISEKGVIALQIHGGPPSESWYRNVRIREIR